MTTTMALSPQHATPLALRLSPEQRHALSVLLTQTRRILDVARRDRRDDPTILLPEDHLFAALRLVLAADDARVVVDATAERKGTQATLAQAKLVRVLTEAETEVARFKGALTTVLTAVGDCETRTEPGFCRTHHRAEPCVFGLAALTLTRPPPVAQSMTPPYVMPDYDRGYNAGYKAGRRLVAKETQHGTGEKAGGQGDAQGQAQGDSEGQGPAHDDG
jgi:hypothetical protein